MRNRLLTLVLAVLLLVPVPPVAQAARPDEYPCLHPDMTVSANGEVLSTGTEVALDGGMAHAGTGLTFTFQARTFNLTIDLCYLRITDTRTWQVDHWPCENVPKPKPARTQSLSWSVFVPLDCKFVGSPNLLSVSLTNGKGSASASMMIYAGAPGFVFPDKQARAFFGPFAMQSDPVNSLTGALAAVETDASVTALGVPLAVTRTYNSNDGSAGTLGAGWRASYSDQLVVSSGGVRYLASDGREIGFARHGTGFAVEPGAARFTLARSGSTYLLTSIDQVRMQFSAAGELQAIRDRNGQGVTIARAAGRVRTVANGRRALSYEYNSSGQIASVRLSGPGVAPRTVRYEYADGRLVGVTSPGGVRTRYEYSEGRLTSETVGDAAKPAYVTEYDADGRVVAQTDAKGGRSTWSWETKGIRGTSTMTDPTGGKWINEYERNWLIRQTDPTGITATFHYDADGNLIRVFDSLGHGARHKYDSLGRVIASTDAVGAVTQRTYNAANDVVATVDPLGRRTTYTYDVRGNLTGTSYAGRTSSVSYDSRGLVTASHDSLGRVVRYSYSADGDLVAVTDPLRQVTRFENDGWGRPIKATSPRGAVSTIAYNDDDQPLSQHGPLDVSTSQTYDGQGRTATLVDARGGTTKLRYDDAGAVVGVTRPSLPEATTTFDASGRVTETVDASGRSQTFEYDGAGRTTSTTYGGRTWKFAYDKSGRLIRTTLPSGKTASFALDARGAPLRITYSDKTPVVSYTWDAAGRRTSMTDGLGTTRFGYDAFDQLTSAGAVSYRWDAVGNLVGRTAAGHTESYTWDAANRLTSAAADGKPLASYRYDAARGTITTTQPGGLTKTERLDLRGRTTTLALAQRGSPLRTISSVYDSADNLLRTDDTVAGQTSYSYDALNRLTAACYGVDHCSDAATDYIRYDYDANGNRTWEKRPSGSTWSLYGPANELQASITAPADYPLTPPTTRTYTYDPDGNLTTDGTTTYTWSAAGKPRTSTTAGVETSYTHTGDGRRATSTTGSQTTRYLWDPLSPQILSVAGASQPTRYLYGSGLLAQQTPTARTALTTTPNGSVLTATTANYEPYGLTRAGPTTQTPSGPTPAYIGGLKLPTGNYLLGQREYNPTTGTFLTTDQAGSANPYAYTAANPLKSTDLQGLDGIDGTLTDVSHISGYISTAALGGAVICTVARACAPAIPILLQVSSATGVISAGTAGILDSEACVLKGNCSQLLADVGVALVASRFPALGRVGRPAGAGSVITVDAERFADLASAARRNHILHGDATGGGHMWPGKPGKSLFPKSWSEDKIMYEISDIATDPSLQWKQQTGPAGADFTHGGAPVRYIVEGVRDGVKIRVVVEPLGRGIVSGFPIG
ncbi:DUF6531 domain-containing protein [Kribbella speibonae]|uniref:Uncharacterized protein n=1 Tax=Kribbella speibonae TaxID=1572660 RepID=A0A4V2M2Q7_9ACTN|nr:DUF6531 domain-containing protein [Kribbella speibonae]TCC29032.1 hypothetical protein E0H92_43425 [Kribbella speibonae]